MKQPSKRIEWSWDEHASHGYNVLANFESTLINLDIIEEYSDIEDTERFDERWSVINFQGADRVKEEYKEDFCRKISRQD